MTAVGMHHPDDPAGKLAAVLDGLEAIVHNADHQARRSQAAAKRSESNRIGLLHIHAAAALIIAPLFASIGGEGMAGASWTVARLIPAAPYSLAALLGAGGIVLAVATIRGHLRGELVGVSILMAWYVLIGVSFGGAAVLWILDGMPPGPRPSIYPTAVYLHLGVVMAVHLRTLRRMRRAEQ